MTPVIFAPEAESEFLDAVAYYEDCSRGLGKRFRLMVELYIKRIREVPLMYRLYHHPFRRCLLPKFPYCVIYTIEPDHIRIIAIAHLQRKPGYWMNRLEFEEK